MSCPHATGCPLFPFMSGSLGEWRRSYCESSTGFRECARYLLASRGEVVPLGLLPNGFHAQHIERCAQVATATATVRGGDGPVAHADGGAVPVAAPAATGQAPGTIVPAGLPDPEQSVDTAESSSGADRSTLSEMHGLHRPRARPRWWTRLAEWMRSSL
jgi:hypothetical protein